jgi:non-ribosomal peptide synthetase component F
VLLSAYVLALSRFAVNEKKEVVCSVINSGRERAALHSIVGFFVNSVIYKTQIDYEESFSAFVQRVNREINEIFQYQSYPMELVFENLRMKYPDIPVSFNMLNLNDATSYLEAEEVQARHFPFLQNAKFDIEPYITEYNNGIEISWIYRQAVFSATAFENFVNDFVKLLGCFAADPHKSYMEYKEIMQPHIFKRNQESV